MKRIQLPVLTNLTVLAMLSASVSFLGLHRRFDAVGLSWPILLGACAILGFAGAFVALLLAKPLAKRFVHARVITAPSTPDDVWLVTTVNELARQAGISMPEVAVYRGKPNAFAVGTSARRALVAVSTGLLEKFPRDEVRAVLAHEIAHIANGEMVTLTLLHGVWLTFVTVVARIVGFVIDRLILRRKSRLPGWADAITETVLNLSVGVFAALIAAAYSRRREYRADWDAAKLLNSAEPLRLALRRLQDKEHDFISDLPYEMTVLGFHASDDFMGFFASHPHLVLRIRALEAFGR